MSIEELKRKIRNEERKINENAAGADWELYRAYQHKLAEVLLAQGTEMLTERGARRIRVDRPTLRLLNKADFPERTRIVVGKYHIAVKGLRGMKTTVYDSNADFSDDLDERQMPQYIHRFIFC